MALETLEAFRALLVENLRGRLSFKRHTRACGVAGVFALGVTLSGLKSSSDSASDCKERGDGGDRMHSE